MTWLKVKVTASHRGVGAIHVDAEASKSILLVSEILMFDYFLHLPKCRARQLLAQKREEKAREEAEKSKNEEMERRKLGHDTARLKQWKEERERKEFENSYKKQKEEDRLAREKVRADLERDRLVTVLKFFCIYFLLYLVGSAVSRRCR